MISTDRAAHGSSIMGTFFWMNYAIFQWCRWFSYKQKINWLATGTKQVVFTNSFIKPDEKSTHLFIYHGAYRIGSEAAFGPRMIELPIKDEITTTGECRTVDLKVADLKPDDED